MKSDSFFEKKESDFSDYSTDRFPVGSLKSAKNNLERKREEISKIITGLGGTMDWSQINATQDGMGMEMKITYKIPKGTKVTF